MTFSLQFRLATAILCFIPCLGASPENSADAVFDVIMQLTEDRPSPEQSKQRSDLLAWWDAQSSRVAEETESFMKSYPEDSRWWQVAATYVRYSLYPKDEDVRTKRMEKAHDLADKGLAAASTPDADWEKLLTWKFYRTLHNSPEVGEDSDLRRMLNQLTERIPQSEVLRNLEAQYVQLLSLSDPAAAKALLERLVKSDNSALSKQAEGMLKLQSLKVDPIDWTFTTLDGTEVDLASMRGKVILIDFWATWCGPCLAEMPNVKAVYDTYRDQGFEVIGITLDRAADLEKVNATIENLELDWPHFLDMENRRNKFAEELGITAIPAPLLFDKEGLLATDKARGARLESEVRLLLGLEQKN